MPPKRRMAKVARLGRKRVKKEPDSDQLVAKTEQDMGEVEEFEEEETCEISIPRKSADLVEGHDIMLVEDCVNNALQAALKMMEKPPKKALPGPKPVSPPDKKPTVLKKRGARKTKPRFKKMLYEIAEKKLFINCKECNKKFRFKQSFRKHMREEHSKLPNSVACDQCSVRCPNKSALEEHIKNVHEREMFACPQCDKKFVRNAHVLRHMAQKGCYGVEPAHFPCEICKVEFTRKDNLLVHIRLLHLTSKDFVCKLCSYSTGTFSKLIIHNQKHHQKGPNEFECDHCGRVVTSRAAMTKHLEIHGEKKYSCDVCGYNTFTTEVMRRHVLTHVKSKPYQCPRCERSFIQRSQLETHLSKHRQDPVCKVCGKFFKKEISLKYHMKKAHSQAEINTANGTTVVEASTYSCEVCGKIYPSESFMRRHVISHTLERARRCMYCVNARAYVRGEQLVKHVRKAHAQVFADHLMHVRSVLGSSQSIARVKKSELDAILNLLDAEAERILQGYGEGVLYGGMQVVEVDSVKTNKNEPPGPLLTEETLCSSLNTLLSQLIDKDVLECFDWPNESVDVVLEKVLSHCGAKIADRDKWSLVQRLRENAKQLFLCVIEDKTIARMLDSHTVDQVILHILNQVSSTDKDT